MDPVVENPTPAEPAPAEPAPAEPAPAEPAPSEPAPSEPTPSEPAPAEPAPAEPAPAEPAPSEPAPAEPAPSEPAPSEPAPAEPAPAEPAPSEPAPAPHQEFTIVITRHELYPREAPHAVVIGFTITCNCNGRNMYIDTQVPLSSIAHGTSDEQVAALAWNQVKDSVKGWCDDVKSKGSLLNKAFVPPSF